MYYLQGSGRYPAAGHVAGGDDEAIDFVWRDTGAQPGRTRREDVAAVLHLEADYLLAIGAVGPPVTDVRPTCDSPDTIVRDPSGGEQS